MSDKKELYGWLFTYNHYNQTWSAYDRNNSRGYWNGEKGGGKIYKDKDINELIKKVSNGES